MLALVLYPSFFGLTSFSIFEMRDHPIKLVNEPVVHSLYCGNKAVGDNNRHGSTIISDWAVLRMRITKRCGSSKACDNSISSYDREQFHDIILCMLELATLALSLRMSEHDVDCPISCCSVSLVINTPGTCGERPAVSS